MVSSTPSVKDSPEQYRASEGQKDREASLLRMIGTGESVLEIGTDDGYYLGHLVKRFNRVTGVDIRRNEALRIPENAEFQIADLTDLRKFEDRSFDTVICSQVLEHIRKVERAATELARVCRQRLFIGVPYRQDLRVAKTTCGNCGNIDAAWGHCNTFDRDRLERLFPALRVVETELVGSTNWGTTNPASSWLMSQARNPYGVYHPWYPCAKCGHALTAPAERSLREKACSRLASVIDRVVAIGRTPTPTWIHVLFER
jgi:SAM-dependent methyltransferase